MARQNVIIMRHAKSDWGGGLQSDRDRPLAPRGRRDAEKMARWLRRQAFTPTCIKSSPAARAGETARIVAQELDGVPIVWENRLYLADLDDLLAVLRCPPSTCWLLVGHNPGLESLVHFCDPTIERRIKFQKLLPTAGVYAFSIDADATIAAGCGSLLCHQRPKLLD
jgi:phosphohistidine phosphatase